MGVDKWQLLLSICDGLRIWRRSRFNSKRMSDPTSPCKSSGEKSATPGRDECSRIGLQFVKPPSLRNSKHKRKDRNTVLVQLDNPANTCPYGLSRFRSSICHARKYRHEEAYSASELTISSMSSHNAIITSGWPAAFCTLSSRPASLSRASARSCSKGGRFSFSTLTVARERGPPRPHAIGPTNTTSTVAR